MNIKYIYHSGFLVETTDCYYLFDYYKGALPKLKQDKAIFVFASHNHQDHYNPKVFQLLQEQKMQKITAVLAKDIPAKKYPSGDIACIRAKAYQTYEVGCNTTVNTLLSTDVGIAFLIKCPEGIIYHAGDLNDWVWEGEPEQYNKQMTGSYRHEINLLRDMMAGETVDVAFIPLDPRQEKDYARGILYFLKQIAVKKVFPMHYWEQPEVIEKFLQEYPQYSDVINTYF